MQLMSQAETDVSHFDPPETVPAAAKAPLRLLPPLTFEESFAARAGAMMIACLFTAFYLFFILHYWAPAHTGVDQNGYLVGGKMIAHTGSMGFKPDDPLGFVGGMWVRNESTGINYPKYPIGLPFLYACVLWIFGHAGLIYAHLVSPISAALAVLGTYFLARQFVGTFASLLAMLVLAFSEITLVLADNPNSHASCLAFGVWGTFVLLRFWETGSIWRGLLGGLLIGYAATIRYTDGLLGLLIALVVLSMIHWRSWRSYLRAAMPVFGWLIPMICLVSFNRIAMHTWTGYDTTNESVPGSAFTFGHIGQNWEKLVRQVHDAGLFFTLPLGILGLMLAVRMGKRRAAFLWLWLIPGTLTYMAYYWAPERGIAYLRFFLTLVPPLVVGVGITIELLLSSAGNVPRLQRLLNPLAGGLIVAIACAMSLYRSLYGLEDGVETGQGMESQYRVNVNHAALDHVITATVPAGSAVFSDTNVLNDLQFIGDYDCFDVEYFTMSYLQRLEVKDETVDPNDPDPLQPARRKYLLSQLQGKSADALNDLQTQTILKNLKDGRRVFVVLSRPQSDAFMRRYERRDSTIACTVAATYNDLPRLREPDPINPTDPRQRTMTNALGRPRGGGGGRFAGGVMRPGFARPMRDMQPQAWQIIELKQKPSVMIR